jgi:hypothetical protein
VSRDPVSVMRHELTTVVGQFTDQVLSWAETYAHT